MLASPGGYRVGPLLPRLLSTAVRAAVSTQTSRRSRADLDRTAFHLHTPPSQLRYWRPRSLRRTRWRRPTDEDRLASKGPAREGSKYPQPEPAPSFLAGREYRIVGHSW